MEIKQILENAVKEYHHTLYGRNSDKLLKTTPIEKRGLLYNCLRRQFIQLRSSFKFDVIGVDSLVCEFHPSGELASFNINKSSLSYRLSNEEVEVIEKIKGVAKDVRYLETRVDVDFSAIKNFEFKF